MTKRHSGGTPATELLDARGIDYRLHSYQHEASNLSYGLEASVALGIAAERVFKTLMISVQGVAAGRTSLLAAAVVPVSGTLDLKAFAAALTGKKADMADPAIAQRRTGYVLGGISPLGSRQAHPTVIDASAMDFESIYVSAGRRGLEIELAPAELARLTEAKIAQIGKV